jgi:hypothetical protein
MFDFVTYGYMNAKLSDWFADEYERALSDEAIALAIEEYRLESRLVRYIITNTEDEADEAVYELEFGTMTDIEVAMQYSVVYHMMGEIETDDLNRILSGDFFTTYRLMISQEEYNKVLELNPHEYTGVFDLSTFYGIFIPATVEETEEWLRLQHEGHDHGDDDIDFEEELEKFFEDDKLLKYIILESEFTALQVRDALVFGTMTDIEAITQYSVAYDEAHGIDKMALSMFELSDKHNKVIMDLQESEYSEVIGFGPFIVFIEASEDETRDWLIKEEAHKLFFDEIDALKESVEIEINREAVDAFDLKKFWDRILPEEEEEE